MNLEPTEDPPNIDPSFSECVEIFEDSSSGSNLILYNIPQLYELQIIVIILFKMTTASLWKHIRKLGLNTTFYNIIFLPSDYYLDLDLTDDEESRETDAGPPGIIKICERSLKTHSILIS